MFRVRNIRNLSHYSRRVNVFGGHCVGFGLFRPLLPVSDTGTGFDSSLIKGEGDSVGWHVSLSPHPVDSRLRGNDGEGTGLTSRGDPAPLDRVSSPQ